MKQMTKAVSIFLVLAMLLCVFSACKSEKTPEELAMEAYNALENNTEKLFYVSSVKHPSEGKTVSLFTPSEFSFENLNQGFKALIESGKTVEAEAKLTVDELEVDGQDYLQQIGGAPFSLTGKLLFDKKGTNFGLSTNISGLPLSVEIASSENAVLIESPFAFKKPVYISKEALEDVLFGTMEGNQADGVSNNLLSALSSVATWAKENLTEENRKHLLGLLKDAIPVNSITVENVTVSDIKGEYISEDLNAECVSLTLDAAAVDKLLTNVNNNVLTDSVVKNLVISFYNCLPDAVKSGIARTEEGTEALGGEDIYKKLCNEFKKLMNDIDTEEKGSVVIKRYFVGGFSVKLDVVITDDNEKTVDFTAWNYYKGSAQEYGVKLVAPKDVDCVLSGGADESKASLKADVTLYTEDVAINETGLAEPSTKVQSKLNYYCERSGEETKLTGKFEDFDGGVVAEYDVASNGNVLNGTVSIKEDNEEVVNIVVKQTEEQDAIKLTMDATLVEGGAQKQLKFVCDGKKQALNGKEVITFGWNMDFENMLKFNGGLTITVDKDSQNTVKEFSEKDNFVIGGKHDMVYLPDNYTTLFSSLIGNITGGSGEQDDNNVIDDESLDEDYSLDLSQLPVGF